MNAALVDCPACVRGEAMSNAAIHRKIAALAALAIARGGIDCGDYIIPPPRLPDRPRACPGKRAKAKASRKAAQRTRRARP
jgi:hypothetical protein